MSTTGPIITTKWTEVDLNGRPFRNSYVMQHKYESKPRNFSAPLPYVRRRAVSHVVENGSGMTGQNGRADCGNWGANPWIDYRSSAPVARVKQACYSKFVGKLKEDAMGWGENLATRKQSLEMILHRVGTLTTAARRLKKGDIPGFCRALGVTPRPTKSKLKKASSIWLEYHFGWEPLYGDIYTACKTLQNDVPAGVIRASSLEECHELDVAREWITRTQARVIVTYQGTYYVDNPNKFLLNKLGVINPVAVAWELVPFSFAVDWFIPVGQYLGSFSDFWGVKRSNEFTSVFIEAKSQVTRRRDVGVNPIFYQTIDSEAVKSTRELGIAIPKPTLKLFKGFSLVRGATAVALLIGMLRSLG